MTALRTSLAGLTTRGRSLLACGLALVVWAVFLGQNDLLRIAVFLLVLPLAAVAVAVRTRYRLTCSRQLDPPRVPAGSPATVRLRLDNISRLPSGVLLLEDQLTERLGDKPRFVLDRMEPGGERSVSYPLQTHERGRYRVGPLAVRLADPFGLCELTRSFASTSDLVVYPRVVDLPPVRLGGDHAGGGDATSLAMASSGTDDTTTREYRRGDDLRKVHWRSTARVGELMVRREEQPFQSRATLLLDGRSGAHRGASSYEACVSAVASIGVALFRAGFALHLVDHTGADLGPEGVALTESVLLDTLAGVRPADGPLLAGASVLRRGGADGVLIAVLGPLDDSDAERVARLRHGHGTCIAVLVDVPNASRDARRDPPQNGLRNVVRDASQSAVQAALPDLSRTLLAAGGWRVLPIAHLDDLAAQWPLAAGRGLQESPRSA